jgi:hypothetical protein
VEKEMGSRIRGMETLIRSAEKAAGMREREVLMVVVAVVIVRLAVMALGELKNCDNEMEGEISS